MKKYREFLNICKELEDIEKEVSKYNPQDPVLSEKAFFWIQKLSNWTKENRPDRDLSKRIFEFWGWPTQENIKKLMQELLLIYYERKVKKLKNQDFFEIINSSSKI